VLRRLKPEGLERTRSGRASFDVRGAGKQLACHELEGLLGTLGARALNGRFTTKHRVSRHWTADFYVPEIKLAIDVEDSAARRHLLRRAQRRLDCNRLGITLLRLTDAECWGDRDALVNKLRGAWKKGLQRRKHQTSSRTCAIRPPGFAPT
jgi:very-short-patch-repair endonuclease